MYILNEEDGTMRRRILTLITITLILITGCSNENKVANIQSEIDQIPSTLSQDDIENIKSINNQYNELSDVDKEQIDNTEKLEEIIMNINQYESGVAAYNSGNYEQCISDMNLAYLFDDSESYAIIAELAEDSDENRFYSMESLSKLSDLANNNFEPAKELLSQTPFTELSKLKNYNGTYKSSTFTHKNVYEQYDVNAYISFQDDNILCSSFATDIDKAITADLLLQNKSNYYSGCTYQDNGTYKATINFQDMFGEYVVLEFEFHFKDNNLVVDSLDTSEDEDCSSLIIGTYIKI